MKLPHVIRNHEKYLKISSRPEPSNFKDPIYVSNFPSLNTKVYNLTFHRQLFERQPIIPYDNISIITDTNPIKQTYFFSAKLDNDERITKIMRINIGEGKVWRKGYLAITNKRFLLADVDGVYSFTNPKIGREVKYQLATLFIFRYNCNLNILSYKTHYSNNLFISY